MVICGEVKELYGRLRAEDVEMQYDLELETSVGVYKITFGSIIDSKKKKLGLEGKSGLELGTDEAEALRKSIKQDHLWNFLFIHLIQDLYPAAAPSNSEEVEQRKAAITLPWWNGQNTRMDGCGFAQMEQCSYDGKLSVKLGVSHSYLTQMVRKQIISGEDYDNPSISGITVSNDDWIMLGLRGGHFKSGSIMTTPAGSVGIESLFDAYHRELDEELYLKPEQVDVGLIGRVFDHTTGHNSLFVFDGRVDLSAQEIKEHWEQSADKHEHVALVPVKAEPEELSDYLVGTENVLVPCTLSLMAYGKTNFGEDWFERAKERLDNKGLYVV